MLRHVAVLGFFAVMLSACGGGSESTSTPSPSPSPDTGSTPPVTNPPPVTTPPVVVNTPPSLELKSATVAVKGSLYLIEANAHDVDNDTLTYTWSQTQGNTVTYNGDTTLSVDIPAATSAYDELYGFSLTVDDGKGGKVTKSIEFLAKSIMTRKTASRLLNQTTFGATQADIDAAIGMSEQEWVESQIAMPMTYHLPLLTNYPGKDNPYQINRIDAWWKATLKGQDQLRQRVAFALSQIMVVSDMNNQLDSEPEGMAAYYDLLLEHAFGNYRDLLEAITLSPVMGVYLDHLGNEKEDVARNIRPDENYARELLQLFSIGLVELKQNGQAKLDQNNDAIPAYSQEIIEGFAKVFTGWTFGYSARWNRPSNNYAIPMMAFEEYHSQQQKALLNDFIIAENTDAKTSLDQALDNIFYHDNVAPFISKQLILRLTTSNPSPNYVERVANVFNDNGEGIRGDLAAVVKAIYLDPEVRFYSAPLDYFGKVREPLIKKAHLWRVFNARTLTDRYYTWQLPSTFGQGPLQSPSVFNFFQPDHQPQELINSEFVVPELQIANDAFVIATLNDLYADIMWRVAERAEVLKEDSLYLYMQTDLDLLTNFGLSAVLNKYEDIFCSGHMSEHLKNAIYEMDANLKTNDSFTRLSMVVYLIINSAEYNLQQ